MIILPVSKTGEKLYEWRGHDRNGLYPDKNLLKSWPAEGPEKVFETDSLGAGFVSPVFTDDRFYITGEKDSIDYLYCFDLNGVKIWQTNIGKAWMRSYPGARSAPTVVDDLIYVGSGVGNLFCVKCSDGTIVWSKKLDTDFNGILPMHGYSESALIDGNKVFWTPGGKANNVVALDRFTGKLIWTNQCFGETSAYNSPRLITLPARKILVTFTAYHLLGLDTETGKLLWSHEQTSYPVEKRGPGYGDTHSNTVLYEDGFIYYVEGDGNCAVKLALSPDGTQIKEVWENKLFDSYMGGVVKIGNYIYGSGTAKPDFRSIDATTGVVTDSLRIGSGAVIAADDMLYYYNQKGEIMLLGYNNGKIQKVSSFRIKEGTLQHFAHPVIHDGILYQRHGSVLCGYKIKA